MRHLIHGLLLAAIPLLALSEPSSAILAADDARVAAMLAGDPAALEPWLHEALAYVHADGRAETKADLRQSLASGRVTYQAYDYEQRVVEQWSEDLAVMRGRVNLRATAGDRSVAFRLGFLAVWQRIDGSWQLRAYQSARLPGA